MGIISEYFRSQRKHEVQYGERTVVLMQIGSFYEIYQYAPEYCTTEEAKLDENGNIQNENIGHAIELSVILNCVLTFENSSEPYSYKSPHKIGFPCIAYEKNRDTLLANDYVIVRIDQVKGSKAKGHVERYVAEICNPTMELNNITSNRTTSNVACIYIEYQQGVRNKFENFLITTGAAVVDVLTGQNRVCEFYSKAEDQVCAVQELYRFLISHYPRELIIHINDMPTGLDQHSDDAPNPYINYLERVLELKRFDRLTTHVNIVPPDYKRLPYQIECLNKIFTKQPSSQQKSGIHLNIIQKRNERIIEELGLERMNYGRIAYMILMQHCYSHNSDIIMKLAKPDLQWIDERKHLVLTHNAIVQLDLVPAKDSSSRLRKKTEIDSLMAVLDQNQTHLGRRLLYNLLQNPMLDPDEIKSYYDIIDEMSLKSSETADPLWFILDRQLKELPDIGRLQRKLEIKLITPKELAVLHKAYIKIINIYIIILQNKTPVLHSQMLTQNEINNFNEFIARFGSILDFEALECCHMDSSAESDLKWLEFVDCPIKPGIYPDLDEQTRSLVNAETAMQQIVDHLNGFIAHTKGKKIEFKASKKKQGARKQDPTGTVLTTTAAKSTAISMAPVDTNICGVIQVLPYTASDRMISSDKINALCSQIDGIRMWMRQKLLVIYESIIEEMATKYNFYVPLANLIAKLDLIHSYAKVAHKYNYHRPEIVTEGDISYLEAREIRHPIIERIIDGAYVTNDIRLGNGSAGADDDDQDNNRSNGILLFGVNQTGKSSLAKAVALNIIMAQAGCFVPSRLRYKPYSKIITRLSGSDNIFKGQSSFAVEMTELRTILRQSDETTLVIGDEIAHGTESDSGMAIAASAILSLINHKSSFLFASHMHDLLKLSSINNLPQEKLKIFHLAIDYNEVTGNLIYNRKLQNGSGLSIYGLIVAKSLGLPDDFMDTANKILLEITGKQSTIVNTDKSRYNKDIYVDSCAICGKTKDNVDLHSHHLIEQKHADEKGWVNKYLQNDDGTQTYLGSMYKHAKDNLIVLCKECHIKLHSSHAELESITISNGKLIRIKPDSPETSVRSGLTLVKVN